MSDDDIFSQLNDDNRTILNVTGNKPPQGGSDKTLLKPMPGGRRPANNTSPAPMPAPKMSQVPLGNMHNVLDETDNNPLVSVTKPLLSLLNRLSQTHQHNDVDGLYNRTVQEIRNFESNAQQKNIDPQQILIARYILCATIDEMVLNTPWGSGSFWPSKSLLSTFHRESTGGQKFFTILERLQQSPAANINLLELSAICLALGFQGKYRVVAGGLNQIESIRTQVHQQIAMIRGEYERELSPNINPIQLNRSINRNIPLWVIGAITAALILTAYVSFSITLDNDAEPLLERINNINPQTQQRAPN